MTKYLLLKYIDRETSAEEDIIVHQWLKSNEMNMKYFAELKSARVFQNMPVGEGDLEGIEEVYGGVCVEGMRSFNWRQYTIAAVVIALLGLNVFFVYDKFFAVQLPEPEKRVLLTELSEGYKHTVYTNKGTKASVDLPDGSKVWLNSDSKIIFPDKFVGPTREVQISGEAFFDVVGDSLQPMIVSTNKNFKIKVLGTKFNVRSYDDDLDAKTTLVSGVVELLNDNSDRRETILAKLKREQCYTIKNNASKGVIEASNISKEIAWKDGILIFEATPLFDIIKQLERWHGIKFLIEDPSILDYKYTAEFNSESVVQIMEMFKFISMIDYSIKDNTVHIWRKYKQI